MQYRPTTEEELALILEEGEGYTLEFKQNVNSDLPRELVAFANASGGRIFIGIDDHNHIKGADLSNKTLSRIETMAADCDPPVAIAIEKLLEHKLLVIHVPESANRPHRCSKGFYLRNGANSQKMRTEDITAFIQAEGRVRFEQQLRRDLVWQEELDQKRLDHFLELANISKPEHLQTLLLNLGVGDYQGDRFYLNQAGVLFFAKEPTKRLFHVSVICALFKGTGKSIILDRKEFAGNMLENIEDALLYLKQHLQLRWIITGESARRREVLELPEAALREAVINAVCHNDYLEEGAQVTTEIFDDRVEIHNPGGLPKGLKPEEFGTRSVCRNPLIASLLLRCNYIEKLGTGIGRIHDALQAEDCPMVKPRFSGFFTLEFPRPSYQALEKTPVETPAEPREKTGEETREKTLVETPVKTLVETPVKTPDLILEVLMEDPNLTLAQVAARIQKSLSAVERAANKLVKQGKLARIGPKKGGHWQVLK
ncbi:MAG TPA: winged helix-turn-helix transcriptional regulator [Gammaproteobacteria bacterium]|nr:winged helix-turn-helix transcriptional regulator [Gammaproteobacteria bacterium]